ncbi:hypothetical protein NX059_003610 [Plenodomus lindquistii]|nr:hypothetical protein NX059_003610 [Plenodomus lindquistii]
MAMGDEHSDRGGCECETSSSNIEGSGNIDTVDTTGDEPTTKPTTSTDSSSTIYTQPIHISPHLTLQPPLSRRGRGPGLVLFFDHYAHVQPNEKDLDPEPLRKWAEEGLAVVQLFVPGKVEDGGEFPLQRALDVLKGCEGCEFEKGVGLISYISRVPYYVEEASSQSPDIKALISYGGRTFTTYSLRMISFPPQLIHAAGSEIPRREPYPNVPVSPTRTPQGVARTYRYEDARREKYWVLPGDENYHKRSAGLAHTRSLAFLKPLLKGPWLDVEAVWEDHIQHLFKEQNVAKAMAGMVDRTYVNYILTMAGGLGKKQLTSFYKQHFIPSNPPDTSLTLLSRTIGTDRIVDESILSLTHNVHIPWLLPGIPPTGKKLELPIMFVATMRGDRLCHEHVSWDQGSALKQLGLLPEVVRFPYEVEGVDVGEGRVEVRLPVVGVEGARKVVDEGVGESNGLVEEGWRVVDDV